MGALKWYKRDPDRAMAGMAILTLEERGAYNSVIDLFYARDGFLPDDDFLVARSMQCQARTWKRLKLALFQKQKLTVDPGGFLVPNGCESTLREASKFLINPEIISSKFKVNSEIFRQKPNEINKTGRHTTTTTRYKEEGTSTNGKEWTPEQRARAIARANVLLDPLLKAKGLL